MSLHNAEKELKDKILLANPVSKNQKFSQVIDDFILKDFWQKIKNVRLLSQKKLLKGIQEEIIAIFVPHAGEDEIATLFEQSIMFNDHAFNSMTCPTRLNIPSTCIDGSTEIKDIVKEQYDSNDDMTNCFSGVNLMENCPIKFLQNRSQSPYLPDVTSRNKTNMVKARVLVTNSSLSDQALHPIRNREVEDDDFCSPEPVIDE